MIDIHTDGSCFGNPGPGGIGIVFVYKGLEKTHYQSLGHTTNNIAELTAIKVGLERCKRFDIPIRVHSDSQYAINMLTKDWKAKKNVELIYDIKKLMKKFKSIEFIWVKGHNGNKYNEMTDRLAKRGSANE